MKAKYENGTLSVEVRAATLHLVPKTMCPPQTASFKAAAFGGNGGMI